MEVELLKKQLSKSIRNERLALGLSQSEFAKSVQLSLSTYSRLEQSGDMSMNNYLKLIVYLGYEENFLSFLKGLSIDSSRERVDRKERQELLVPIIDISTKKIILDKNVFKGSAFYSVANGYEYDIPNFIDINLENPTDENISLLIRYFGIKRLKPYIDKKNIISLSKMFKKHISYLESKLTGKR